MTEYHVGCGIFGIYAGTLNKDKTMWRNKTDVTDEACKAVAQYLVDNGEMMDFDYNGNRYRMSIGYIGKAKAQ